MLELYSYAFLSRLIARARTVIRAARLLHRAAETAAR